MSLTPELAQILHERSGQRAGRPDRRAVEEGRVLDLLEATARYAEEGTRGGPLRAFRLC